MSALSETASISPRTPNYLDIRAELGSGHGRRHLFGGCDGIGPEHIKTRSARPWNR